jgi:hypothetical protein
VANIFQIEWKTIGWAKRLGIGIALLLIGVGCLGILPMMLHPSIGFLHDTLLVMFDGFGLLMMLNSRFKGLGFTLLLMGVFMGGAGYNDKVGQADAGLALIVLAIYWLVRFIKWAARKIRAP